ncbi:MAG: CDP-diacylglycerol--serine O-phosphatidyltransferase [Calditrichaeota bacterium]|nr:CDP-diacylglycerol--serine O-phosphatidyltransferase [Calditrichota bacterium]MCB9368254.1 CDP-diacylglycerol--serine O-phosphatidyltransferase [Calditrichota bacterium]
MRHLANILTSLNLVFGFFSMMLAIDGRIEVAAWLIILAVVMDAFDGKAARFFGASSPMGLQFDSLADVVSMGVAPSILAYAAAFREDSLLGMIVCTVPVLAAAYRLARFNVRAASRASAYEGLTSPLHASLIATFILMNYNLWGGVVTPEVLAGLLVVTSLLMVSKIPLAGLPRFTLREHGRNLRKVAILVLAIVVGALNPPLFGFPIILMLCVTAAIAGQIQSRKSPRILDEDISEPISTGLKKL